MIRVNLLSCPKAKLERKPDNVLPTFFSQVVDSKQVLCKLPAAVYRPTPITKVTSVPRLSPGLRIVRGDVAKLTARVLAHLAEAELHARLADRDDLRVAWILALKASEGHPDPFAIAFWQYFGETPETLVPFLSARADLNRAYSEHFRLLDKQFTFRYTRDWREQYARIIAEIGCQKKPVQSVRFPVRNKEAA